MNNQDKLISKLTDDLIAAQSLKRELVEALKQARSKLYVNRFDVSLLDKLITRGEAQDAH